MIYRIENITDKKYTDEFYTEAYNAMTRERKEKADRLRNYEDKRLCVFSDNLLREMLKSKGIDNPDFYIDEKGKPHLKDDQLYFSISHSKNYIACAVDTKPVGIDIETATNISLPVILHSCTREELDFVFKTHNHTEITPEVRTAFLRIWTAKEALFKCTGKGISTGFKNVSVVSNDELKEIISDQYQLVNTFTPDYALSVVVRT